MSGAANTRYFGKTAKNLALWKEIQFICIDNYNISESMKQQTQALKVTDAAIQEYHRFLFINSTSSEQWIE